MAWIVCGFHCRLPRRCLVNQAVYSIPASIGNTGNHSVAHDIWLEARLALAHCKCSPSESKNTCDCWKHTVLGGLCQPADFMDFLRRDALKLKPAVSKTAGFLLV